MWALVMSSRTGIRVLIFPPTKGETSEPSLSCALRGSGQTRLPPTDNRGRSCSRVLASKGCPGRLQYAESGGLHRIPLSTVYSSCKIKRLARSL